MNRRTKIKKARSKPTPLASVKPSAILWGDADLTPPTTARLATSPKPGFRIDAFAALSDDFRAELLPSDPRSAAVVTACLTAPGELAPGRVLKGWRCDVRGFVSKPKAARGTVLVTVGTTTKAFDFPWRKAMAGEDFFFSFRSREVRLPAPVPDAPAPLLPLLISAQLVIQRQNPGEQVTLTVDGFDLTAELD